MERAGAKRQGLRRPVARLALFLAGSLAALGLFGSAAQAAPAARPVALVAFGDSLSAGYQLPAAAAFPVVLERALKARGRTVTVANAGVSGDTTTGGLDRVAWSVPDGIDGVILELGANDMLRGTDPALTARNLDAIITRLKARGIPVLLAGMRASTNLGPDYIARFDAIFPNLAKKHGLTLYPFFLEGVMGSAALNLEDRLHPNAKGVEAIVAGILPTIEIFLDRIAAEPKPR